jgi:hypothetical protein
MDKIVKKHSKREEILKKLFKKSKNKREILKNNKNLNLLLGYLVIRNRKLN